MKKLLIITALLFTYHISNAQLTTRKATKEDLSEKDFNTSLLNFKVKKNFYIFTYLDASTKQYSSIKHFMFENVDNTFDQFYNIIIDGFTEMPEDKIVVEFSDEKLFLNYTDKTGTPYVEIEHIRDGTSGFVTPLTKEQIDMVFKKN